VVCLLLPQVLGLQADFTLELTMNKYSISANTHLPSKADIFGNRLVWLVVTGAGVAAALALYRLADMDPRAVNSGNPEWVADWAVIWICAAVASLPLILPFVLNWKRSQQRRTDREMLGALMAVSPNLRQEMMVMAARDTSPDSLSKAETFDATEALSALGGLTVGQASTSNPDETTFGLAKRPLMAYL
jgi:hypothetical protein